MMRINLQIFMALLCAFLISCGGGGGGSGVTTAPALTTSQALLQMEMGPEERVPILTKELEYQLKLVSRVAVPAPLVWYSSQTRTLYWVMTGDYNLDGVVGIPDITPLAIHYGESWTVPPNPAQGVISWWTDGSSDRQISIADITPIAVYYGVVAPFGWETNWGFASRVECKAMWKILVPIGVNWWEVNIWPELQPPPNRPPVACFDVSPTEGVAPLTVHVDGSASCDPDGFIVEYRWYFHGGGGAFLGGNLPTANHTYDIPGDYTVWLVVVDNDGATDWSDTGFEILVTEPNAVSYNLFMAGTQGHLTDGAIWQVDETGSQVLNVIEWRGSDGSSVSLSPSQIQFSSDILPNWVWNTNTGELQTVLWAEPLDPDLSDPGNIFIDPGVYPAQFSATHQNGSTDVIDFTLEVVDRADWPPSS